MAAQHTVSAVAGQAASLFTHSGGIRAIAANGPVSLQAHTDRLEILADKEITVISVNDRIVIKASDQVALQAGESSVTLQGGDITFSCPGKFSVKGSQHSFDKGSNTKASFLPLPSATSALFDRRVRLTDEVSGTPLSDIPYFVRLDSGAVFCGVTDEHGLTEYAISDQAEAASVYIGHLALKEIARFKAGA
jgi:type VI secretion system secreted protein VgrG